MTTTHKGRLLHDIKGLSLLPAGQLRAVDGLVGGDRARIYVEASEIAGMSLGTLHTHLRRVRINHPVIHKAIYRRRRSQLRERHSEAVARARDHTKQYFKRVRKWEKWLLGG